MQIIVGIGEYAVSSIETDTIKTFALASCVAVVAYHPAGKLAGMVHVALPEALPEDGFGYRPSYYADTGVPLLIGVMCRKFGCSIRELTIRIYGGADSIQQNDQFNIGRRNIEAVTAALTKLNLKISSAEVGGNVSRTITLHVDTGDVEISTRGIII